MPPPPPPADIPAPPPAPPAGIPMPPPAPATSGSSSAPAASGARGALLSQIQSGLKLKKAVTKDKGTVKSAGRVMGDDTSASDGSSKDDATSAHIASNSDQRPMGMPALGGLFANGMPTLKKSTGIATGRMDPPAEEHDSRRESTDWFGRLASHPVAEVPAPAATPASVPDPVTVAPEIPAASIPAPSSINQQEITNQVQSEQMPAATPVKVDDSIESKVDFENGYRAKALWSYSAMAPDQISFEANDYLRTYPPKDAGNVDWVYGVAEKDEGVKGWLPKAYIEQVPEKFKAKALFAYAAQNEGELSVERGDIVDVLEKPDPQWWRVQNFSAAGMLPASYLEEYIEGQAPVVELPIGKAKALYAYAGQSAEELSVEMGDMVDIMEKPDPLWWRARSAGATGMVPSTYLEEIEGQSTSAVDDADSDSSEYESETESSSDTDTDSDVDSDSDGSEDDTENDEPKQRSPAVASHGTPTLTMTTPAIAIVHAPKHRPPPPRPTSAYPKADRLNPSSKLSTSAPSRPSILIRKLSEGALSSHLTIPTAAAPGTRPRAGSHSSAMVPSPSHSRFRSEGHGLQRSSSSLLSSGSPRSQDRPQSPLLLNSPLWSASVDPEVYQSLSEKEKKRQEAIHELILTEQVYLSTLYLVQDEFQRPLQDQGLITSSESQCIFKEWDSLLDLSQSIVDELVQRQSNDQGVVLAVGDVINSHIVERAGCFMRYCANHREASTLLTRRITESKALVDFLNNTKSKPSCRGLDIFSFLLQPLQRITRYPLLIKKILKSTDEDHIDYLLLSEALVSAETFLDRINESIRSGETKQKLEEIQRKMPLGDMAEGLVLTSETKHLGQRQILLEGNLRKAKSGRKLYVYLCNDLVLLFLPGKALGTLTRSASHTSLSKSASSSTLSSSPALGVSNGENRHHGWTLYHAPIPLERVKVKADPSDNLKFTIVITNPLTPTIAAQHDQVPSHLLAHHHQQQHPQSQGPIQSTIYVKAGSAKERKAWVSSIEKAIETLAKAPRDYGMRTSIRPPLAETIGTMTIRVNEGVISSREFAKSKAFLCTLTLGEQLFTTKPASTDHAFSGSFSILWRESVIFSMTNLTQALDITVKSTSPFSPDVIMGVAQVPFHTVVPYGERGTEVHVPLSNGMQVKFYMSYKAL
ncbi:Intersectin 1 (SH3 domain protein) [Mortierella polycephala]|uniref:Intersectin 1 (SH3 domain protein) n=1 Tax=Mortierella polycephala TaxID=41804 RepID=A0A9P6PS81_9FUNG|nr:Intersectin 1 (SH3 domain protein) [Mortierella polycephala]